MIEREKYKQIRNAIFQAKKNKQFHKADRLKYLMKLKSK